MTNYQNNKCIFWVRFVAARDLHTNWEHIFNDPLKSKFQYEITK